MTIPAIPRWHFGMMNDQDRNKPLRDAIVATVRPDDLVLDIGTGGGLTALWAARCGAYVVSCEANPAVADLARRIVAANMLSHRITIVEGMSTDLRIGPAGLPRPADVLTAEVFDCALIGEGALPALADARARLLAPDARLIPAAGTLWAQVVDSASLHELNHVHTVDGFDLSAFNAASTPGYFLQHVDGHRHSPLTDPFELLRFDFAGEPVPVSGTARHQVPTIHRGMAHAAVLWFSLDLGHGYELANPPGRARHWHQGVYTFPVPIPTIPGGSLCVEVEYEGTALCLRPARSETAPTLPTPAGEKAATRAGGRQDDGAPRGRDR